MMSDVLFEVLVKGRTARRVEDLDEDTLRAIANSAVASDFAGLDEILEDWPLLGGIEKNICIPRNLG